MTDHRWSAALIVLAAVTRVAAALALGDRFHFADEAIYVDAARRLLAGEGYGEGYDNVPAPPVLLAALAAPWPTSLVALRVAHAVVVGLAGALVLHALGTRTVGLVATRAVLVLYACDPLVVVAGGLLYPEAGAAVVLTGALLAAVVAAGSDRFGSAALAGALAGVTVLFRPVALVLVPVLGLWVAAAGTGATARRAARALLFGAACAVAIAPWALQNVRASGAVVPSSLRGVHHAPVAAAEIERDGLAASLGRKAWSDPSALAARMARELAHFWELYPTRLSTDSGERRAAMHRIDARLPRSQTFPPALRDRVSAVSFGAELLLAITGVVLGWRRHRALVVLCLAVALVYGLGYALFIAKMRYRIVVLPELFLLAGLGVACLAARRRSHASAHSERVAATSARS